jgi:hypothetical protein
MKICKGCNLKKRNSEFPVVRGWQTTNCEKCRKKHRNGKYNSTMRLAASVRQELNTERRDSSEAEQISLLPAAAIPLGTIMRSSRRRRPYNR